MRPQNIIRTTDREVERKGNLESKIQRKVKKNLTSIRRK